MTIAIRPHIRKSTPRRDTTRRVPLALEAIVLRPDPLAAVLDEDTQMLQAAKRGFVVGTPAVFAITAGMALIAGTTLGVAALIGGWCGVFGGWYFGTIFFINSKPRGPRPQR